MVGKEGGEGREKHAREGGRAERKGEGKGRGSRTGMGEKDVHDMVLRLLLLLLLILLLLLLWCKEAAQTGRMR